MVEAIKTRYGPSRALTKGSGIAAASSITTSSAWESLAASPIHMFKLQIFCKTLDKKPTWMNILNGLSVVVEDVHSHHGLVELRVGALDQLVVEMLLVVQGIKTLEDKVKEGVEVLGAGRGDEDVGVAKADCSSNGKTQSSGLATSSGSSERNSGL